MEGIAGAKILRSIPGIDRVYTTDILAEIERFDNHPAVARYTGLTWNRKQSGTFKTEETKQIRSGNRFLRYYLVEAVNSAKYHDPEFGAYYRKKYNEVTLHQHKRILVLTARKFVLLVDALLRNDQFYTPRRKLNSAKD